MISLDFIMINQCGGFMLIVSSRILSEEEWHKIGIVERDQASVVFIEQNTYRYCSGCLGCWVKTPGECKLEDGFNQLLGQYVNEDKVVLISEVKRGTLVPHMKNFIDRLIPLYLPYIRLEDDGLNHLKRYEKYPSIEVKILNSLSSIHQLDARLFLCLKAYLEHIFKKLGNASVEVELINQGMEFTL